MATQFYPGQTLGIIGEGINGPMLAQTARQMGFRVAAYSPDSQSELLHLADLRFTGNFTDWQQLRAFAESVDFVTYESQNVPSETLAFLQQYTNLPQGTEALDITMDRLMERTLLEENNINVLPYASAIDLDDVVTSAVRLGYPVALKPIQKTFDHGRERVVEGPASIGRVADLIDTGTFIVESWLHNIREFSVVAAKGIDGSVQMFPIVENIFVNKQLIETLTPVTLPDEVEFEMQRVTEVLGHVLNYRGAYEVDFYLTETGNLITKRMVATLSRPSAIFNQVTNLSVYEQHIRAIAGLPLALVTASSPAVLVPFNAIDDDTLRTQWLIKDNWHFTFYHNAGHAMQAAKGHFVATGTDLRSLLDQIDATGIIAKNKQSKL